MLITKIELTSLSASVELLQISQIKHRNESFCLPVKFKTVDEKIFMQNITEQRLRKVYNVI